MLPHAFLDTGWGQLITFMEPHEIQGVPNDFDARINRGLCVPDAFYHFAFEAGNAERLEKKRLELLEKGVEVTEIGDHGGGCRSISFKDPNGIQLEYCCMTRALTEEDTELWCASPSTARATRSSVPIPVPTMAVERGRA